MKTFETSLIDNSFEDKIQSKLDTQKLLKKFKNTHFKYAYFSSKDNKEYLDFLYIMKERIIYKTKFSEIAKKLNCSKNHVLYFYYKNLELLKQTKYDVDFNTEYKKMKYWQNIEKTLTKTTER